jgi:hypothetical protein
MGIRMMFWDSVREAIAAVPSIDAAVVYVSRAYGNFRHASDVDICLFGRALTKSERGRLEETIDDLMWPWYVDLTHWERSSSPRFRAEIRRDAVPLFHREGPPDALPDALLDGRDTGGRP